MKRKYKKLFLFGTALLVPSVASIVLTSCSSTSPSSSEGELTTQQLQQINDIINQNVTTINNPRTEGLAKQAIKEKIEALLVKNKIAIIDTKLELTKDVASNTYNANISLKLSKEVKVPENNYFIFTNNYLVLKNPISLKNFIPGTTQTLKIKENFTTGVGATSGSAPNAAGYASIKFNAMGTDSRPTILISPEHIGDSFYYLVLPRNPMNDTFEGATNPFQTTDFIKYELVNQNSNWYFEDNVLGNKDPINMSHELVVKGTIYADSYIEFMFNVKFIKTINTSDKFIPTGTSSDKKTDGAQGTIVAKNDHNMINVVSDNETHNFFNLKLPTETKNDMFTEWTNSFPENSRIEYTPITASANNPFSLTKDGIISNATAITSPLSLVVNGIITSANDANSKAEINLELIISPKLNVIATNQLITKVESSTSNAAGSVYQQGTANINGTTITIKPANPQDRYFKISLPDKLADGMFTGLDKTNYPAGSKINYGPIYSSNENLDFSLNPIPSIGSTGPTIFNHPNKPLTATTNKFNINVFVYDKSGANPIKIPFIIIFDF